MEHQKGRKHHQLIRLTPTGEKKVSTDRKRERKHQKEKEHPQGTRKGALAEDEKGNTDR